MILAGALVAIFIATTALGALARRFGQPAILGELVAGVLLGSSVLGLVDPSNPVIAALSQLGVVLLLFTVGLQTKLSALVKVGSAAATVAVAGVVAPMTLGYFAAVMLGLSTVQALVCATALCATSVGITARVLSDLGRLDSPEGGVVLGAAVIDDIIGLVILAVVASVVSGQPLSLWSAMIVGAFAGGMVLRRVPQRQRLERATATIGRFFVPIFFASVGAAVDLRALANARSLTLGAVLIVCGIFGKVVAGFVPWWFRGDKLFVGIGMVPRGEVGLIFAQMGLATAALGAGEYGALMLMVLVTTFVTPPALAWRSRHPAQPLAGIP